MTRRVCSPPWPGRRNRVSWPGRRRCGLPSAGPLPRSASPPLPGGLCGADGAGTGDEIVPGPGWPRRWSRQWLGWAVSSRPTRTCCPALSSSWPTWPSRRRLRLARTGPPPWGRDGKCRTSPDPPASRPPGRTARRAPLSLPLSRDPRRRTTARYRRRPAIGLPGRPAALVHGTRRRHRPVLAPCHRGPSRSTARASPRGRRASPR